MRKFIKFLFLLISCGLIQACNNVSLQELEEQNLIDTSALDEKGAVSQATIMLPGGVPLEVLRINGGTFMMGNEVGNDDETPRQVTLDYYYISKYEITQEQWQAVTGSNPSNTIGYNYPVESVSYYDIQNFIESLNSYTGEQFRLPTEAEWEYAAKGGANTMYSGSEFYDDVGWFVNNSNSLQEVGTKQPNAYGLYDMSGNVWEWVYDWYGEYPTYEESNPTGPSYGEYRVVRGGSHNSSIDIGVTLRNGSEPDASYNDAGFRLAASDVTANNQEEEVENESLTINIAEYTTMEVIRIPGGEFNMGSDYGDYNETPVRSVSVSDFYMGKYEVTQAQWVAVMGYNPSTYYGDNYPVDNISWEEAVNFLERISNYSGYIFRLPTEAEWEYAAKANENFTYAGSDNINDVGWVGSNSFEAPSEVGTKKSNAFGLYDMTGNISEWVYDWYDTYSYDDTYNPYGPAYGTYKVLRGGSYLTIDDASTNTYRGYILPTGSVQALGFRAVSSTVQEDPIYEEEENDYSQTIYLNESVTMEIIRIPGGSFNMGGDSNHDNTFPIHEVAVNDFYMCKYEITQDQWFAVMGYNTSSHRGGNYPVESISYNDIINFINRLNEITSYSFRLPTEAEWEYAANGGETYQYAGSSSINSVAWSNQTSNSTQYVGQLNPNGYGLYDMSGNVAEVCSDWFGNYLYGYQNNPTGPTSGTYRVIRGGSFAHNYSYCSTKARLSFYPTSKYNYVGFRLVADY
ncbi:formylglycine-generating enzyme family protein [Flammeovirga agarivorans]|uniref:Formylglycine-generating enzyme family protein n=1 Tax=Flammeovirga agarivorans TaxID=2726742 RepID=A0A7X8XW70_9BACT|nr:SUMF1/EgtB/PvdO family nonheme iron enzyme [Flammeovirga agarivorans]NLR91924.1 formylglycine-generating enzyme family protein [Flammeovirga agarivorans]